jgi:hypothetical protein
MTPKAVQATIKLGSTSINAYQLDDGSYAASGLFKLDHTDVYLYQDRWYWLGSILPATITSSRIWDYRREVFLALKGNELCYRHSDPMDLTGTMYYVVVPKDIESIIDFCFLGELVSNEFSSLSTIKQASCPIGDGISSPLNSHTLLRDTADYLIRYLLMPIAADAKDS